MSDPRLERVWGKSPRGRRIPDAEREAGDAEHGGQSVERRAKRTAHECEPEGSRKDAHRYGCEDGEQDKRRDGERRRLDTCEQEDTDTRASAHPVHETDREGPQWRPGAVPMGVAAFFPMCM